MWANCTTKDGERRPGSSVIANIPLLLTGDLAEHLNALVVVLDALVHIRPTSAEAIPFLLDVVHESAPLSAARLDSEKRQVRQVQELHYQLSGRILEVPDDHPSRAAIRGNALLALSNILYSLRKSGERVPDCTAEILPALDDRDATVRFLAAMALAHCREALPPSRREEAASRAIAALSSPEAAMISDRLHHWRSGWEAFARTERAATPSSEIGPGSFSAVARTGNSGPTEAGESGARTSEMAVVRCPQCHKRLRVPVSAKGRRARCPTCGQAFRVPGSSQPPRE